MQYAAAGDLERFSVDILYPQRDIALDLLEQTLAQLAAADILALLAEKRRIVDAEHHRDGRLVDRDGRHGLRRFGVADRVGDIDIGDADDRAEVAALDHAGLLPAEPLESEELLDLRVLNGSVALDDHQRLAGVERAAVDAPDADAADEVRIIKRGDLALNRTFNLLRRRHTFENRIEQRKDRLTRIVEIPDRPAVAAGSVKQRKLQLLVARIQLAEEVEHLRVDRIGPGVRLVDLVDDDHRAQIQLQRLVEHEPRLRHRPLGRIDEQDHAVRELQHALDLAAEIAVSRGVDHVDLGVPVLDADILGENRDSALAFEIVAVEKAVGDDLVLTENLGLAHDLIDQRRLAVVDVGNDGNVS